MKKFVFALFALVLFTFSANAQHRYTGVPNCSTPRAFALVGTPYGPVALSAPAPFYGYDHRLLGFSDPVFGLPVYNRFYSAPSTTVSFGFGRRIVAFP